MSDPEPGRLLPYVMTRGRSRPSDYAFLGADPPTAWWRGYAGLTDDAFPTLLVEADRASWRVYLSGIPSVRTDQVGTPIRFTLTLNGPAGAGADAVRLCRWWLAELGEEPALGGLGAALDGHFPDDGEVTALLTGRDPEQAAEVRGRLAALLAALPEPKGDLPSDLPGSWFGSAATGTAAGRFAARIDALLAGGAAPGRALLLNLVHTPTAAPLPVPGESLAVLTPEPAPPDLAPLLAAPEPAAAPAGAPSAGPDQASPLPSRLSREAARLLGVTLARLRCRSDTSGSDTSGPA